MPGRITVHDLAPGTGHAAPLALKTVRHSTPTGRTSSKFLGLGTSRLGTGRTPFGRAEWPRLTSFAGKGRARFTRSVYKNLGLIWRRGSGAAIPREPKASVPLPCGEAARPVLREQGERSPSRAANRRGPRNLGTSELRRSMGRPPVADRIRRSLASGGRTSEPECRTDPRARSAEGKRCECLPGARESVRAPWSPIALRTLRMGKPAADRRPDRCSRGRRPSGSARRAHSPGRFRAA